MRHEQSHVRILEQLTIRGFKSIRGQKLALGPLNLLIGANGAGKSNLVAVFQLLREIVTQNLAAYTAIKGGPDALLYFGRKTTPQMHLSLEFVEGLSSNGYTIELVPTEGNELVVDSEIARYHERGRYPRPYDLPLGGGTSESKLRDNSDLCARQILADLESYRVYHFHDTSSSSAMKQLCDVDDNRFLREDAANLAAYLYFLQAKHPNVFATIEGSIRQVAPFFDRFTLAPSRLNESRIQLEWKERGRDAYFKASSLSDGTLRFICLATLLLQPQLPGLIVLDEPELGLHPAAIALLADMMSAAATRTQLIAATQSVTLVDQFEPEQVWAVDREDGQSTFKRLSDTDMSAWTDDYSLGELWQKNVVGARP
jgi:predicted ATPase